MASDLVNVIFNQFVSIVERFAKKSCFEFNECDFDYHVREAVGHRLIDVVYVVEDKCGRRHDVIATIDYTNICFEDLTSPEWKDYLSKIAIEFVNDICPKKYEIPSTHKRKCRTEPPHWEPLPCGIITTVIKKQVIPEPEPDYEVVIENECACVPICKRTTCTGPKQQYVIKYVTESPWKCGDVTQVVDDDKKYHHKEQDRPHYFSDNKGHPDFNNHKWKSCCGSN